MDKTTPPTLSEWLAVLQPTMAPGEEGKFWLKEGAGSYSVIGGIHGLDAENKLLLRLDLIWERPKGRQPGR